MSSFSLTQRASLAFIPKISGLMSMLGSLWIVLDILGDRAKQKKLNHRILFGLSCVDVILSIILFCSTWPIPRDTTNVLWAVGNEKTCRLQGFIIQLGSAGFIYNSALTIYFVLVVLYSIKEERLLKYEWIFHAVPLSFGLSTSITGLVNDYYGNSNLWCWIGGFDDAYIFRWAFYYAPLWFCFLIVLVGMLMVFWGVHIKERQTDNLDSFRQFSLSIRATSNLSNSDGDMDDTNDSSRRSFRFLQNNSLRNRQHPPSRKRSRTQQVAGQAALYIFAFYWTYFFSTINRIYQQVTGESLFVMLLLHVIFNPLQGTWNFLIYRRPHMLRLRRADPDLSWWSAIWKSLRISVFSQGVDTTGTTSVGTRYPNSTAINQSSVGFNQSSIGFNQSSVGFKPDPDDQQIQGSSVVFKFEPNEFGEDHEDADNYAPVNEFDRDEPDVEEPKGEGKDEGGGLTADDFLDGDQDVNESLPEAGNDEEALVTDAVTASEAKEEEQLPPQNGDDDDDDEKKPLNSSL